MILTYLLLRLGARVSSCSQHQSASLYYLECPKQLIVHEIKYKLDLTNNRLLQYAEYKG
jgi:hypothetical protein